MLGRALLACLVLAACESRSAPVGTVRFAIDMSGPRAEGWFDPATESVGLRGGVPPLSWNASIPLSDPDADGVYEGVVTFAADADAGIAYKVKVDGTGNPDDGWEIGANRTFDRTAVQVVTRAFNDTTAPLAASYTGDIRTHEGVGSGQLVPARTVVVYLPPGYATDTARRYPVLYMHDGQNVFDQRGAGTEWKVDETAERLIAAGEIEPAIIVAVSNTAARVDEYTPTRYQQRYMLDRIGDVEGAGGLAGRYRVRMDDEPVLVIRQAADGWETTMPDEADPVPLTETEDGYVAGRTGFTLGVDSTAGGRVQRLVATRPASGGNGRAYADFLVREVKPFIDSTYRTLGDVAHTSVGGSSLGGLITMAIAAWYPDVFSGYLVVSPSVWWDDGVILRMVAEGAPPDGRRVWLDMGTAEGPGAVASAERLRDALVARGWTEGRDLAFVVAEGAEHTEAAWAARGPDMLRFLYAR
jgi:predicted alpha/beta superfamily hydrolase